MSFRVKFPDGKSVYINNMCWPSFTTYKKMEQKALEMAKQVGGQAFYENGLPRFQREGVDLFPRWIPIGEPLPAAQIELETKMREIPKL